MKRHRLAAIVLTAGLIVLAFGPGYGTIALSTATGSFVARIDERFTSQEQIELLLLGCFEDVLSVIPDGSTVWIPPSGDYYVDQRFHDIAFPRLTLLTEATDYDVILWRIDLKGEDYDPDVTGTVVLDTTCSKVHALVVRNG